MVIRVDREIFDPVGVGSTAGGNSHYEDGTQELPWQPRPFPTRNDFLASHALELMATPADLIRQQRPPMINELFPPEFGYDQTPLTINDVLDTDRWAPQIRSWISGTPRQIRRADWQEDMWSGTERNVSTSVNPAG